MSYPSDKETIGKIIDILQQNPQAKQIVLQFPKQYLGQAFSLTKQLKRILELSESKEGEKREFYTLFDSMKKECCTDIIGAQHINYDVLIHFGEACFSEPITANHFYLFPTLSQEEHQQFEHSFQTQHFAQQLRNSKIKYLLTQQKLYSYAKTYLSHLFDQTAVQLLKLPFDRTSNDHYLIFGYYATSPQETNSLTPNDHNNVLVLFASHPQPDNKLISDIHLTMGSFSSNKALFTAPPQIFISSLEVPTIEKSNFNYAKPLMMRLALIGQLHKYDVFGLLVSNAGTHFSKQMVEKCTNLLEKHKKRYFVFMMNNLNEVKLGNFPEIQVYVVISCFNNSCFTTKEFYRLVVTPMDLQVAFDEVSISEYNFDLNHPRNWQMREGEKEGKPEQSKNSQKMKENEIQKQQSALSVQQKQQMVLASTLQTLDYYRNKEYKGLDFSEKKAVQKIVKGKIGLAEEYKPLPKEESPL